MSTPWNRDRVRGDEVAIIHEGDDEMAIRDGARFDDRVRPLKRLVLETPQMVRKGAREREEIGVHVANEHDIGAEVVLTFKTQAIHDGRVFEHLNVPVGIGGGRNGMTRQRLG